MDFNYHKNNIKSIFEFGLFIIKKENLLVFYYEKGRRLFSLDSDRTSTVANNFAADLLDLISGINRYALRNDADIRQNLYSIFLPRIFGGEICENLFPPLLSLFSDFQRLNVDSRHNFQLWFSSQQNKSLDSNRRSKSVELFSASKTNKKKRRSFDDFCLLEPKSFPNLNRERNSNVEVCFCFIC